jgi:hypothetical protein
VLKEKKVESTYEVALTLCHLKLLLFDTLKHFKVIINTLITPNKWREGTSIC